MPSGGAGRLGAPGAGVTLGERHLQHRLVELLGPVRVPRRHRHVRDVALAQPGGPGRRPQQRPPVPERVDDHRGATVGLVGRLPLHRGAVAPGPLGGPVDVGHLQVEGVAERRGGVGRPHGHVGPEAGGFGEHQHPVADADLGVADRAVRVDVRLAAPLRRRIPRRTSPWHAGRRTRRCRGSALVARRARARPGPGRCWDMVPPVGAKTSRVSRSRSRPAKSGSGSTGVTGSRSTSNGSVIASPPLPRRSGGTRRGPAPATPRWRARCGPGAWRPRVPAARRGTAA